MLKSPLSDITGDNTEKQRIKNEKKKKDKKFKSSFNNAVIKELAPFIIWASITVVTVGGSFYYTNIQNEEYAVKNYSKLKEVDTLEMQVNNLAKEVGANQATLENSTNKVNALNADLSEQGKVKSPLSQGYYFISYLTYLSSKYNVDLKKLDVLASDGQSEIDLTKVADAKGSFDLLPIKVDLAATPKNLRSLFDELYTKRIILVKDLEIVNSLDGNVNASFRVFFREVNFVTDEYGQIMTDPNTGAPLVEDTTTQDPNQQGGVDPNQQGVTDPNQVQDGMDPSTQTEMPDDMNNNGGGELNGNEVIDPITELPVE